MPSEQLAVLGVVFAAYFLKGFSGFGTALVLVPTLTLIIGPHATIALIMVMDVIANTALGISLKPKKDDLRRVLVMAALVSIGTTITGSFVGQVSADVLQSLVGIVVLASLVPVLVAFTRPSLASSTSSDLPAMVGAFIGGLSGGLTTITGPPVVAGLRLSQTRDSFRRHLVLVFGIQAAVAVFVYARQGLVTDFTIRTAVMALIPMAVGMFLGHKVSQRTSERQFSGAVAIIVLLAGLTTLLT